MSPILALLELFDIKSYDMDY